MVTLIGSIAVWLVDILLLVVYFVSFSCLVKFGEPRRSTLDSLLFNLSINGVCDSFRTSKYLLVADDLKIHLNIRNVSDQSSAARH